MKYNWLALLIVGNLLLALAAYLRGDEPILLKVARWWLQ